MRYVHVGNLVKGNPKTCNTFHRIFFPNWPFFPTGKMDPIIRLLHGSTIRNQSVQLFVRPYMDGSTTSYTVLRLSPCQMIKMKCSAVSTISGNPTVKRFFFLIFQYLTYTVWLLSILKLFHFGEGKVPLDRHFNICQYWLSLAILASDIRSRSVYYNSTWFFCVFDLHLCMIWTFFKWLL